MIVKAAESERVLARLPNGVLAVLLYGPDQGLVRERAERLALTVVPELRDPFRVADMDGAAVQDEPARLASEASALSMTGGRRVVRIRAATNALADLFESFLASPWGDSLVIVEAGELAKNSSLRQAFEDAPRAAAIPCYLDTPEAIAGLVRSTLKSQGIAIAPDALDETVLLLGADRGTTRQEIEKLLLYAHGTHAVALDDVRASLGDESEARIEEAWDAAGEGDTRRLDRALEKLWTTGISPIAILRAAMGHLQRLAVAKTRIERGETADAILKGMRPAMHFSRVPGFKAQLRDWSEERIASALDLLLEAETLCKSTAVPAEAACARALFNVSALARLNAGPVTSRAV